MIELRGVSKRFGRVAALRVLSLEVGTGEVVVLTGPSGSGKTTVLRLIAGLEKPDEGEVVIDGQVVSRPSWALEAHHRGIGFVFQTAALWPHMTIAQHLRFALGRNHKSEDRVAKVLETTRLTDIADRRPAELSGGQAQRTALARALVASPRILLLDEPLAHLEPELRIEMHSVIRNSADESKAAVLYVSHHVDEAEDIADRVLRLETGRIV